MGHTFLLDKKTNKHYLGYIVSSSQFPFVSTNYQTIKNDYMITYQDSEVINNIIVHSENKDKLSIPTGIFDGLSDTDNPILCIYKLK